MSVQDVTLDVGEESYPGRLNVPEASTEKGILMVPGGGHGPFGDIFLRFARTAAADGYEVARFETWPFVSNLEEKQRTISRRIWRPVSSFFSHGTVRRLR